MLNTTDLVKVADSVQKDKTKYFTTFNRPYLSFGPNDAINSETSEFETVDNGKQSVTLTSPKESKTVHEATDLFSQALQYFQSEQEKDVSDPAKRIDPLFLLLKAADNGLVASLRMEVRNKLVPKVINEDKAILNMAQAAMQRKPGRFATLEDAVKFVKETLL